MDSNNIQNGAQSKISVNSFELQKLLGKGTFAKVFKVCKVDGKDEKTIYAMKVVSASSIKAIECAVSEQKIIKSTKHPFILNLFYSFKNESKLYLVVEYAKGGDLRNVLLKRSHFTEAAALFYMRQIVLAVEYLHSRDILHRDIKLANVLIMSTGFIKLADFGLSVILPDGDLVYGTCGTRDCMAPEMFSGSGYGKEVDWWAVGVLFYNLLVGTNPNFTGKCLAQTFIDFLSPSARNLLDSMLRCKITERLGVHGALEIKKHTFFHTTNWENVYRQLERPPYIPQTNIMKKIKKVLRIPLSRSCSVTSTDSAPKNIESKYKNLFSDFTFITNTQYPETEET